MEKETSCYACKYFDGCSIHYSLACEFLTKEEREMLLDQVNGNCQEFVPCDEYPTED